MIIFKDIEIIVPKNNTSDGKLFSYQVVCILMNGWKDFGQAIPQ